jgi:hypothetical protein
MDAGLGARGGVRGGAGGVAAGGVAAKHLRRGVGGLAGSESGGACWLGTRHGGHIGGGAGGVLRGLMPDGVALTPGSGSPNPPGAAGGDTRRPQASTASMLVASPLT